MSYVETSKRPHQKIKRKIGLKLLYLHLWHVYFLKPKRRWIPIITWHDDGTFVPEHFSRLDKWEFWQGAIFHPQKWCQRHAVISAYRVFTCPNVILCEGFYIIVKWYVVGHLHAECCALWILIGCSELGAAVHFTQFSLLSSLSAFPLELNKALPL